METLHLQLKGMSCASCANTIEQAVKGIPGVKTCNVNFGIEQASVQYNAQQTNADQITRAESQVGYSAVPTQEFGALNLRPKRLGNIHLPVAWTWFEV